MNAGLNEANVHDLENPHRSVGQGQGLGMCGFMFLNWNDLWDDILESQIFILHQHSFHTCPF